MIPEARNDVVWPVHSVDDQHFVELPEGSRVPITIDGRRGDIPSGWRPLFLYAGFSPIYLLELRNEDGRESTWFLDRRLDRLAFDVPETLQSTDLASLRQAASPILSRMWDQLLEAGEPAPDAEVSGFLALGPLVRGRLALLCEPEFKLRTVTIDLETAKRRGVKAFPTNRGATLDTGVLWRMLTSELLAPSLEAIRAGYMDWESPVGGPRLTTSGGIWLTDFLFAWRVVSDEHDTAFYVLASGHPCQVIGVLLPSERIVFTIGGHCRDYVERFHHVPIELLLFRHICRYGDRMIDAWRDGISGFSVLFRERQISGQLRHDLTGVEQLVQHLPSHWLPEIIGMWGAGPEIYGDTEMIYPELSGRINRSIDGDDALIRHAYGQRRILLRTTGSYITKKLRGRLIAVNTRDPGIDPVRATLRQIRSIGCPLVLLGLRVENRTVEDLPGFCSQIIDHLVARCGQVAIVIDGHNPAGGATPDLAFASKSQMHAKEAPIEAERRVVRALQDRYESSPVILIDNIGESMARSIVWCHNAHFFVTMYGTGLAKYRWACNLTGLIVTSQWTLRNASRLHSYEQEHLEDSSPLMFLPERFVEDLPDSPQLIAEPGNPPARWNFNVRAEGLHAAIDELLQQTYPPAGRTMALTTEHA
jgi:hypothetical protein